MTLGKMLDAGRAERADDRELPYIRAGNIQDDGFDLTQVNTMPFSSREANELSLRRNDLLVVEGGAVGTSYVVDTDMPGWSFQKTVNRVRARAGWSTQFLSYVLRTYRDVGVIDVICNKSTIPHLTAEKLQALRVPVPPIDQQRRIARFLDRETAKIDALIGKQEQLIETLRERRTALVLHSTLGMTDVEWSGNLGRVVAKLGRHPTGENEVVTAYRDGVVTRRSLRRDEGYTFSDAEAGYQGVAIGDLVFHGLDGFAGAVGVSDADGDCSPVYHVCRPTRGDARYLAYLLRAMGVSGLLSAYAWSVRQRSVDYRNWALFASLPLALPSSAAQRDAADDLDEKIEKIDVLVNRAQRFIRLSRERRSALIMAAVTGQIDVREVIRTDAELVGSDGGVA